MTILMLSILDQAIITVLKKICLIIFSLKKAPFAVVFIDGYNDFYKDYDYYKQL